MDDACDEDCGHTEQDHAFQRDLRNVMQHMGHEIVNPRIMMVVEESGEIHFATSIPPGEAAQALEQLAARIRRYGGNQARDHFDRGAASRWN